MVGWITDNWPVVATVIGVAILLTLGAISWRLQTISTQLYVLKLRLDALPTDMAAPINEATAAVVFEIAEGRRG